MAAKRLITEELLVYLQSLPPLLLTRLYESHPACLAVLRNLPDMAKQYLMRLLFVGQAIPLSDINMWCNATSSSQHQEAISILKRLCVIQPGPLISGQQGLLVNGAFQKNMREILCGGGTPWLVPVHYSDAEDKHGRDVEFLNTYADQQWENILNFMVGDQSSSRLRGEVLEVLQHAGLMSNEAPSYITTLGFQFLLVSRTRQVWYFVMQYLKSAQARELVLLDCLNLIFQLKFSTLGKDYSIKGLTPTQIQFMQHLCQFGLVYQRKKSSKRYYPTKLATNLASDDSQTVTQHNNGFILIETNYRVLAYTESRLHIATLALFCQLQYRFPNMVVGTITRESIHQALVHGITAQQVLAFLCMHAHPDMLEKTPIIPPTVSDQIRLWEIERDRLHFQDGVVYSDFLSATDFEKVYKYAKDLDAVLWSNNGRRLVVVHPSRHDEIKQFWKRQKQS